MSSRLFQRVREERGLAYSVYSFVSSFSDSGYTGIYAGCLPGKVAEVVQVCRETVAEVPRPRAAAERVGTERRSDPACGPSVPNASVTRRTI